MLDIRFLKNDNPLYNLVDSAQIENYLRVCIKNTKFICEW